MFSNHFQQKSSNNFYCINCNYSTSRKSNYDEHLMTLKHKKSMTSNVGTVTNPKKPAIPATSYCCQTCGKSYKDNSGLWRHKQKCNIANNDIKQLE